MSTDPERVTIDASPPNVDEAGRIGPLDCAMDITARLARFAATLDYEDMPADLRDRTRMAVLDGLGIMLGAVDFARTNGDEALERYLASVAPEGPATVVGLGRRTSVMTAAFANGTLSEVLDCSDCNLTARIHNGPAVVPTALALAERAPATGREVMAAIMAGYEVGTRLGHAIQPAHWYRGFQITGTLNTCAAAATAGRLEGLDADAMAAALGAAGFIMPVSGGDNVFKGHGIKPIHGGQPALCGISAAWLAQAGYRAGPLEGEPPRHHAALVILGDGKPNLARAVAGLGEDWTSRELAFKPYPIGLLNVAPVEICLALAADHRIDPRAIEAVEVATYADAVHFTGRKYTTPESNFVDAHLSLPFCVAAALIDGEMTPSQLTDARLRDPAVHELARRVRVTEDAEMTARYPHEWPVRLEVRMRGGGTVVRRIDQARWSPRRPPGWAELAAKFDALAGPVIGARRARRAIEFVARLDDAETLAPLMDMVSCAEGGGT